MEVLLRLSCSGRREGRRDERKVSRIYIDHVPILFRREGERE